MLEGKTSSSVIKEYDCELAKGEKNDCVPRAIAVAYDISYEEAHKICEEKFDRKPKKGTRTWIGFNSVENKNMIINNKIHSFVDLEKIKYEGSPRYKNEKNKLVDHKIKIVVRQLVELYLEGTYIVLVRNHAFALVNGVIIGNLGDYKKKKVKVENLIEIKDVAV